MPVFSAKGQAKAIIKKHLALGRPRHGHQSDNMIHSVRTAQAYEGALKRVASWMKENKIKKRLCQITKKEVEKYLRQRAKIVSQKTLDQDRQALKLIVKNSVERIKSKVPSRTGLAEKGRAYSRHQIEKIASVQSEKNALSTRIAYAAGLRGSELLTIRRASEQSTSGHRQWLADRFAGQQGVLYTVTGKGGLKRHVMLPNDLTKQLEARRLQKPRLVCDRGVRYEKLYDIGGGRSWAMAFVSASKRALGWSTGAHGLRHTYAQERISELRQRFIDHEAKTILSQELGHFRADITEVYLR